MQTIKKGLACFQTQFSGSRYVMSKEEVIDFWLGKSLLGWEKFIPKGLKKALPLTAYDVRVI